ncbi:DPP IV N-terminal domain-containing protein [Mucilaginibacter daejeonensis]|uniref:S9 family peptidase n=1 Tax=Mucilaginibacter daejeonensis TaxID=398049 RepID=UPI001D175585|nr:DPP IV N-terminal domain-containing protein [Mucilaginibacter daejeonensis]UEG53566.1 DPP IV N-terminal domain-containing protein [Mucilaginibacter daejeonensis]
MNIKFYRPVLSALLLGVMALSNSTVRAQGGGLQWAKDGYHYYALQNGAITELDIRDKEKKNVIADRAALTPPGKAALQVSSFSFSDDRQKVLIFTNTKRVWRYNTRGDYWVYDMAGKTLKQIGKGKPESSLMFAKISPDGTKAAYVSEHNLYMEDLASGTIKPLTTDGTSRIINGTFDWAYEEEFDCRDGFRWSPDSRNIAYWQIDARKIRNYLMLNTTDSAYSFTVPVEYPVAGTDPSSCRIKVVNVDNGKITNINVPGDAVQHYIPRMEWAGNSNELMLQQLNRAQNESKLFICNISSNASRVLYQENDKAWIDVGEWEWIEKGKRFVWLSEKDGWRHAYAIDRFGKEKLLTKGNYDVVSLNLIDETNGFIYFMASPTNAAQRYLYRVNIGGGTAERVSPADQPGTHRYDISPNGLVAIHSFNNSYTMPARETIGLPAHKPLDGKPTAIKVDPASVKNKPEFFTVTTADGVKMDGWMMKPDNFDPSKKYPIVFYVYGEPASQTAADVYGAGRNREYAGSMAADGYIYVSMDNRGAPVPKGREWRKAIYRNIGILNVRDQAMAAKQLFSQHSFIDTSRVAVWGWSGGGSSTLNLMFQYPDIYKTGIAVAAVGWQLSYDNIYQERYMGVPTTEEGRSYFIKGSPVTHAKNLRGNLLYVHGTGDDNVHYSNAEKLINELVKYNKQFQLMSYPMRSHGIYEGEGTSEHLRTLYTKFLKENCPPGAR